MVEFDVTGLSRLRKDIEAAGYIPEAVLKEMVDAQAEVTEKSMIYNAGTMLQGPYYEGAVARSTKRKKPRITKSGATEIITFEGEQHGNRLGEIAFVNEYGKKSQPARPFIANAIRESLTPAADAAREVLNEHLKTHNL